MRDFTTKVNDTAPAASGILTAEEDNVRNLELETAVTAGGLSLDAAAGPDTATDMLAESITRHASGALWCTDSGAANAYVVAMTGDFVPPKALFEGLTVKFKPGAANTGASTLNAFGLGAKAIVDHVQAALISGCMDGRVVELIYRPSIGAGSWQLPAWSNALYVGQTPSSPPAVSSGEGWQVNGSNQGDLNFAGLTADGTPLAADVFAFYDDADSEHKGITYAQLAALLGAGGGILGMQVVTASGTYTKTTNTTKALVFATGGGGGGASPTSHSEEGGGGGAGATVITFVDLSAVSTVACTIGAGGAGGSSGSSGSNGGSTSFGSHATAGGGNGGYTNDASGQASGGEGGTATVGTFKIGGAAGEAATSSTGGNGASSFWGGGGLGGARTQNGTGDGAGIAATAYGAGGGGSDAQVTAGAGASGCILVLEFA